MQVLKDLQDLLVTLDHLDHLEIEVLDSLGQLVSLVQQEVLALPVLLEIEVLQDYLGQQDLLDRLVIEDPQDHKEVKDQLELPEIKVAQVHLDFRELRVALDHLVHPVLMET